MGLVERLAKQEQVAAFLLEGVLLQLPFKTSRLMEPKQLVEMEEEEEALALAADSF